MDATKKLIRVFLRKGEILKAMTHLEWKGLTEDEAEDYIAVTMLELDLVTLAEYRDGQLEKLGI